METLVKLLTSLFSTLFSLFLQPFFITAKMFNETSAVVIEVTVNRALPLFCRVAVVTVAPI